MTTSLTRTIAAVALVTSATACGAEPETSDPTGVDELTIPTPSPDPDDFVEGIDNEYLPFTHGSRWEYRAETEDEVETITVTVTDETKVVAGVPCVVVHDVVRVDGEVIEDTYDWYAQDTDGNVWYFGEDTTEYDGKKSSTAGSWEAGVDGALAGLVMPAEPRVGDGYAQEYYEGEAEDRGQIISVDESVTIGYGTFDDVLKTEDTTPLEPKVLEYKYYAPGIGVVLEDTVAGGVEHVELVSYTEG